MSPPQGGVAAEPPPEDLAEFYDEQVQWEDCDGGQQCARVTVPMNYDEPEGETIEIALRMQPASGTSRGHLFLNPGGPGESGTSLMPEIAQLVTADLLANYNVVSFDPRGVDDSDAVRCLDSAELEEYYGLTFDVETDAGWDAYIESLTEYGQACLENTGALLEFVDTGSTVRDLDILRAAVGEEELHYLGYSYGTYLGARYAEVFPGRVGRFVLDGGMDPALGYDAVSEGQVRGFDRAYRSYIADCQAGPDCPLPGDVDEGMAVTRDLLTMLEADPVGTSDPERDVTDIELMNAMAVALYRTDFWPALTEALTLLLDSDDGSVVLSMSDVAIQRDEDGEYPPDQGAFAAINCLDFPAELDRDRITAHAESLEDISDVFGPYFGYGEAACATRPFDAVGEREPIAAEGAAPILVIGTTRDPATPVEWAESLAEQLQSGVLLTYDGDGHTAYAGSPCVNEIVDAFLIQGEVPDGDQTC